MKTDIRWNGETIGQVVRPDDGHDAYIIAPIVIDVEGHLMMGHVLVLAAGLAVLEVFGVSSYPVIRECTTEKLAELRDELARVSRELRLPIAND